MKIRVTREQVEKILDAVLLNFHPDTKFDIPDSFQLTIDPSQVVEAEWIYEERVPEPGKFCSTWRRRIK